MSPMDTVRAFWTGYWNDGDVTVFQRLIAPEIVIRNEFAGESLDRSDLIELHQSFRKLWSSVRVELDLLTCDGDRCAAIVVCNGRGPDGAPLRVEGVTIMRVADGRIVEDITRFDTYEVLVRLGRIDASTALLSLG